MVATRELSCQSPQWSMGFKGYGILDGDCKYNHFEEMYPHLGSTSRSGYIAKGIMPISSPRLTYRKIRCTLEAQRLPPLWYSSECRTQLLHGISNWHVHLYTATPTDFLSSNARTRRMKRDLHSSHSWWVGVRNARGPEPSKFRISLTRPKEDSLVPILAQVH